MIIFLEYFTMVSTSISEINFGSLRKFEFLEILIYCFLCNSFKFIVNFRIIQLNIGQFGSKYIEIINLLLIFNSLFLILQFPVSNYGFRWFMPYCNFRNPQFFNLKQLFIIFNLTFLIYFPEFYDRIMFFQTSNVI